jgi:hypothetical protein
MLTEGGLLNFFTLNGKAYPATDTIQMQVGQIDQASLSPNRNVRARQECAPRAHGRRLPGASVFPAGGLVETALLDAEDLARLDVHIRSARGWRGGEASPTTHAEICRPPLATGER